MTKTITQSIEEKIEDLSPQIAEEVLSSAILEREEKRRAFIAALDEGLADLEEGRYTDLHTPEELRTFLDEIGKEVFDEAR